MQIQYSEDQVRGIETLRKEGNIFLTGRAGTGKSFLINQFIQNYSTKRKLAVVASTAAAAMLVQGTTFHSFFGLGLAKGTDDEIIDQALENRGVVRRIARVEAIIMDEISMISGRLLDLAFKITGRIRGNLEPWGGIKIIAVGDFAQLPPIPEPGTRTLDWAFLAHSWRESYFNLIELTEAHRSQDLEYLEILNQVRDGIVSPNVREYLNKKKVEGEEFQGTYLFSRKDRVEQYNLHRLKEIDSPPISLMTEYTGNDRFIDRMKRDCPIPEVLTVKKGAQVMFRRNDPEKKYYNGMQGFVEEVSATQVIVKSFRGKIIEVEKALFEIYDADGKIVASAKNFPLNLSYGLTIHKSQGASIDRLRVNISKLWEAGQAYVALSRSKDPDFLEIEDWDEKSIICDPEVKFFHQKIGLSTP